MSELVTRIPAEDTKVYESWSLPEVQSANTVSAVNKEAPFTKGVLKRRKKYHHIDDHAKTVAHRQTGMDKKYQGKNNLAKSAGEIIEDVVIDSSMTELISVEEMNNITECAEKKGFDKGYQEGKDKGYVEGRKDGLKKAERQVDEQTEKLNAVTQTLLSLVEKEQSLVEKKLVSLVCQLAQVVIKKELSIDSSMIVDVVQNSLSLINDKKEIVTLYLHSQDIPLVKASLASSDFSINFEADDSLLPGGCRIDNQQTRIDSSIDQQLHQLLDDFSKKACPFNHVTDQTVINDENESNDDKNIVADPPVNDSCELSL